MNRKNLLWLFGAFIATTDAHAGDYIYTPYIGADYSYSESVAKQLRPTYHAFDVQLGSRYNDYFGTELFYQQSGSDTKRVDAGKYKTSYRSYGMDLASYLPLGCERKIELTATAGLGEYVFNKKFSGAKHHNDTGIGYRFGGGVLYNLNEHVSFRLGARYIHFDGISDYDHSIEYLTGVRYYF